jgi:hypothetical protein
MNQIINMVMRTIMRKMLNKGIDAGFSKSASLRGGRSQPPQDALDDFGTPVRSDTTQNEIRAARRSKPEGGGPGAQQAKQAMKMLRRSGKL